MRALNALARVVPGRFVPLLVRWSSTDRRVAMCLHRVSDDDPSSSLFPELTQRPAEIDEFVSYFDRCPERLTVTFDDGYLDSVEYVSTRAARHPEVDWMINVCPEKTTDRVGHAWDAWMEIDGDRDSDAFLDRWQRELDGDAAVLDAAPLGDDDRYVLATAEQCREVARHPNVTLGNHTDHHFPMAWLDDDRLRAEIARSEQRFDAAFDRPADLVLPFGCPPYVRDEDIPRIVDATSSDVVWTVAPRPYRPTADDDVEVRPRFGWCAGELSPKAEALYIAAQCVRDRIRSRRGGDAEPSEASVTQIGEPIADAEHAVA